MKNIITPVLLLMALLLASCAQSPQQLSLTLNEPPAQLPPGAAIVDLKGIDARGSNKVGSRGGVYAESSVITTTPLFLQTLVDAYRQALLSSGRVTIQDGAPVAISLILEDFSISTPKRSVLPEIVYSAKLSVKVLKGRQTRLYRYSADQKHTLATVPSDVKSQELTNELFSVVLSQAIADDALNDFMMSAVN